MKDFNRKKETGMGTISKKKKKKQNKKKQIIFRTRHLVVDDGERTARVLPCGITFLPLRHGDRLPHCC